MQNYVAGCNAGEWPAAGNKKAAAWAAAWGEQGLIDDAERRVAVNGAAVGEGFSERVSNLFGGPDFLEIQGFDRLPGRAVRGGKHHPAVEEAIALSHIGRLPVPRAPVPGIVDARAVRPVSQVAVRICKEVADGGVDGEDDRDDHAARAGRKIERILFLVDEHAGDLVLLPFVVADDLDVQLVGRLAQLVEGTALALHLHIEHAGVRANQRTGDAPRGGIAIAVGLARVELCELAGER